MLRRDGNEVIRPKEVNLSGATDPVHFEFAIRQGLVILSADRTDFKILHNLIQASGGKHPGVLLVRFDNNPKHDMKAKHIAAAVKKLENSGASWEDEVVVLNFWR